MRSVEWCYCQWPWVNTLSKTYRCAKHNKSPVQWQHIYLYSPDGASFTRMATINLKGIPSSLVIYGYLRKTSEKDEQLLSSSLLFMKLLVNKFLAVIVVTSMNLIATVQRLAVCLPVHCLHLLLILRCCKSLLVSLNYR